MPHKRQIKLSAKLRIWAKLMYNPLGQRDQIKLFSDSVCATFFWGSSNPNTENSFKFIFFIFDLLHYSIYQCKLHCHITEVRFLYSFAVLSHHGVSRLKLASVHLLLWTWAHKVRRRQVLYGNMFFCLICLCLIQLYVMASEICEEKYQMAIRFKKYFTLERRQRTNLQKRCPIWLLRLKK